MTPNTSILLCIKDRLQFFNAKRRVCQRLIEKEAIDDTGFCRVMNIADGCLLLDIRKAIADFFGVPPSKVHPGDALDEFDYKTFELGLHMFVIGQILTNRNREIGPFVFPKQPMKDIQDFVQETCRVLDLSRPT